MAAPGSEAKVQVLIERASRREALFHPDDATIAQAQPVVPAENSSADCPACVVAAPEAVIAPAESLLDADSASDLELAS
jgi:hypothetical protein